MKLGIVCVYLAEPEDAPLLDLHLRQIQSLTRVPYEIFACPLRLPPELRRVLDETSGVRVCACAPTELRGYQEHAHYLEQLIPQAVDAECSHLVLLNVDSFPVRAGWAEEMIARLSPSCVLVGVKREENDDDKPHPSCILFHRDFYVRHRPTLLVSDEERASDRFQRYLTEHRVIDDTGIGYGYRLYSQGLGWFPLVRSNRAAEHYILGSIYGDLVFHLGGATRDVKLHIRERERIDGHRYRNPPYRAAASLVRFVSSFLPMGIRKALRPYLRLPETRRVHAESRKTFDRIRTQLLDDPPGYLNYLRFGVREESDASEGHASSTRG